MQWYQGFLLTLFLRITSSEVLSIKLAVLSPRPSMVVQPNSGQVLGTSQGENLRSRRFWLLQLLGRILIPASPLLLKDLVCHGPFQKLTEKLQIILGTKLGFPERGTVKHFPGVDKPSWAMPMICSKAKSQEFVRVASP